MNGFPQHAFKGGLTGCPKHSQLRTPMMCCKRLVRNFKKRCRCRRRGESFGEAVHRAEGKGHGHRSRHDSVFCTVREQSCRDSRRKSLRPTWAASTVCRILCTRSKKRKGFSAVSLKVGIGQLSKLGKPLSPNLRGSSLKALESKQSWLITLLCPQTLGLRFPSLSENSSASGIDAK